MKHIYLLFMLLLLFNLCDGQAVNLSCTEKEKKSDESFVPIIIKTCFLKNFKFVSTSYPDPEGRYFFSDHEVFIKQGNQYIGCSNSDVFNKNQDQLVAIINKRIRADFKKYSTDSTLADCLEGIDSIPLYRMNDFDISFEGKEIWFEVQWGDRTICRAVNGTVVTLSLNEIERYLR